MGNYLPSPKFFRYLIGSTIVFISLVTALEILHFLGMSDLYGTLEDVFNKIILGFTLGAPTGYIAKSKKEKRK